MRQKLHARHRHRWQLAAMLFMHHEKHASKVLSVAMPLLHAVGGCNGGAETASIGELEAGTEGD